MSRHSLRSVLALGALITALSGAGVVAYGISASRDDTSFPARRASGLAARPVHASSTEAGGLGDGIKVHGSWTITVLDPDGTLASRTEFENALTSLGAQNLSKVLARFGTTGSWQVYLSSGGTLPCNFSGTPIKCAIVEPASTGSGSHIFKTLTLDAPSSGQNANALVLSGSAIAGNNSTIESVETALGLCQPDVAPAACQNTGFTFTAKSLSTGVAVTAGQQIQVTVVISFS